MIDLPKAPQPNTNHTGTAPQHQGSSRARGGLAGAERAPLRACSSRDAEVRHCEGGGYGFAGLYRVVGGGFVIHEDFAQVLPVCFTWAVMIASGYFLQTSAS